MLIEPGKISIMYIF